MSNLEEIATFTLDDLKYLEAACTTQDCGRLVVPEKLHLKIQAAIEMTEAFNIDPEHIELIGWRQ